MPVTSWGLESISFYSLSYAAKAEHSDVCCDVKYLMNDEDLRINYDVFKGAETVGGVWKEAWAVGWGVMEVAKNIYSTVE